MASEHIHTLKAVEWGYPIVLLSGISIFFIAFYIIYHIGQRQEREQYEGQDAHVLPPTDAPDYIRQLQSVDKRVCDNAIELQTLPQRNSHHLGQCSIHMSGVPRPISWTESVESKETEDGKD